MRTLLLALAAALISMGAQAATCPLPQYPTVNCTGVPAGTALTASGSMTITTAGTVVDAKKVTGYIDVRADNVVIKRSEVSLYITNRGKNLLIEDSTVGSSNAPNTCNNAGASGGVGIGEHDFTMRRVYLRGWSDGVRISGSNVTVEDSLIVVCSNNPADHGDGVQAYGAQNGRNIHLRHNVWDQRPAMVAGGYTAPIWLPNDRLDQLNSGAEWTEIKDNILAGGTMSFRMPGDPANSIPWTAKEVSGNKIVNKTWYYEATEIGKCNHILAWNNNAIVTYDFANGVVLSEVSKLTNCPESGTPTPTPEPTPVTHITLDVTVHSPGPIVIDSVTSHAVSP